ncbi:hypothetical protein [Corallococcus exiguus]|uniref:hypothetical protein n=1 Tax=Corallococcus exiguus TaxID=83462 RepID=UPI001B8D598B|nr:hypothetical protein [Corallococcus exiguus]
MVKFLFNYSGRHIANLVNDQLHSPTGANIGHYLEGERIFIDMKGRYLGEIVAGDRLLKDRSSPHASANYGNYGNYGNVGNFGNPGNYGSIGRMSSYDDVVITW